MSEATCPGPYPPGWDLERAIRAGEIAKEFHDTYESLAPQFTYKTRPESAVPWLDVPQVNKQLMIATVVSLLERGVIADCDSGEMARDAAS